MDHISQTHLLAGFQSGSANRRYLWETTRMGGGKKRLPSRFQILSASFQWHGTGRLQPSAAIGTPLELCPFSLMNTSCVKVFLVNL